MRASAVWSVMALVGTTLAGQTGPAHAFELYSQNGGDNTNCGECHGDFRSPGYVSNSDGQFWGNLHNIHRSDMLNGDCDACHSGPTRFPVILDLSDGGDGLAAISCVGCHGRAGDDIPANPDFGILGGFGAGLRQHHTTAGVTRCTDCHDDADPANYTPVGEQFLPDYYANPGDGHPAIPTGPCNDDGSENFAGDPEGLDNDGDDLYDGNDSDCIEVGVPGISSATFSYLQNAPNPFNPETVIRYSVPTPGRVRLAVYTVTGQLVRVLVDDFTGETGIHEARWNGRDRLGNSAASGTYFYRIEMPGVIETKRMVLTK